MVRCCGLVFILLGMALGALAIGRVAVGPSELTQVMRILPTPEGVWSAGYGSGVWRQTSRRWQPMIGRSLNAQYIPDITRAADGTIYAATWMEDGLLAINPRTGRHRVIRWDADSPGFNRGDSRATRVACLGNTLLVNTFGGIARYHPRQGWTRWGGLTEQNVLFATPAGCWAIINESIIRISPQGKVDRSMSLRGVVDTDRAHITSLWAQGDHLLFGDSTGVLRATDMGDSPIITVTGPPPGVKAALLDILPVGHTIYLAYGQSGFPQEQLAGGLALYDRLSGHITRLDAFAGESWRTLAQVRGEVWVGGHAGIARVPAPLTAPVIVRSNGEPAIMLPDAMRAALQRLVPGFTPCPWSHYTANATAHYRVTDRQIPSAVIGDFNADGHADAVLQGHAGMQFTELCLLSQGNTYRVVTRWATEEPPIDDTTPDAAKHFTFLTYMHPGHYPHLFDGPLTLHADAFDEVADGKASVIVYIRHGRLVEHAESD